MLDEIVALLADQWMQGIAGLRKTCLDWHVFKCQLQTSRLDLGEVENVVDQPKKVLPSRGNVIHVAPLLFVERTVAVFAEQIGKAQDGVQGSSQFMTHRGKELILELARTFQFFFGQNDGLRESLNVLLRSLKLCRAFPDTLLQSIVRF